MKTLSLKAKLINCFFALTLVTGLCVPSLATAEPAQDVQSEKISHNDSNRVDSSTEDSLQATHDIETSSSIDVPSVSSEQTADQLDALASINEKAGDTADIEVMADSRIANPGFVVTGGVENVDYTFENVNYTRNARLGSNKLNLPTVPMLVVKTSTPLTIANANPSQAINAGIRIAPGVDAFVTLNNVNISGSVPFDIVTNSKNPGTTDKTLAGSPTRVHLQVADGSTNTLFATAAHQSPGIRCGEGSELYIDDALLNRDVNNDDILPVNGFIPVGTTYRDLSGVEHTVKGTNADNALINLQSPNPGKLNVTAGYRCAGIGAASWENSGKIVVNGGDIVTKAWALNGDKYNTDINNWDYGDGAGIGGAYAGHGTELIFNGGKVDAHGSYHGSAIGAGMYAYDAAASSQADWAYRSYPFADAIRSGLEPSSVNPDNTGTLCGNITINGGYIKATGGLHGNAFGQGCGGTATGCTILITGGTLLPASNSDRFDIGGQGGDVIITGGSVNCNKNGSVYKFQGNAGNGVAYGAYTVDGNGKVHPVTDKKVKLITIDLSADLRALEGGDLNREITSWNLTVQGESTSYGAPARFNNGFLYLWLTEEQAQQEVRVELSYKGNNGESIPVEPLFRNPGSTEEKLKRYVYFDIQDNFFNEDKKDTSHPHVPLNVLSDYEQKKYGKDNADDAGMIAINALSKPYDGLSYSVRELSQTNPLYTGEVDNKNIWQNITYVCQYYNEQTQKLGSEISMTTTPSDSGLSRFTLTSTQYSNDEQYKESYYGHRAYGWCEISRVPAVVNLTKVEWGNLKDDGSWEVVDDAKQDAGNRIKVEFNIRSQVGTALTCGVPTGHFQLMVDDIAVGEPITLTKEAITPADGSKSENSFATQNSRFSRADNVKDKMDSFDEQYVSGRARVDVTYFFDPTKTDGLLGALDQAAQATYAAALAEGASEEEAADKANEHQISVLYIPDKNYVEGFENNEANKDDGQTVIIPVDPSTPLIPDGSVTPDDDPKEEPITPPDQTDGVDVVQQAVIAKYSDFHAKDDPTKQDFFTVDMGSKSAMPIECYSTNPAVVDYVKDEKGNPVFDKDGKIQVKVNSCGIGVIVMKQAGNALYRGQVKELTVTVIPDPSIVPETEVRVIWNNLTHPNLPAAPGDILEYTVIGSNLTEGSSWQDVVLGDEVSEHLVIDPKSVEVAKNFESPRDLANLTLDDFKDVLFTSLAQNNFTVNKSVITLHDGVIGSIYGGQSSAFKFQAQVGDDLVDREVMADNPPTIPNTPAAEGSYGVTETADLVPGQGQGTPIKLEGDNATKIYPIEATEIPEAVVIPKDPVLPNPDPNDPDNPNPPVNPDDPDNPDKVDPDIYVNKTAKNLTHPEGNKALTGDIIAYTITTGNKGKDTCYYWPIIKDELPVGLEPVAGSFKLTHVDGSEETIADTVYNKQTRTVALYVDDLYGGEEVTLTFQCTVTPEATDIKNTAQVYGTTPSDKWKGEHPTPDPTPEPGKDDTLSYIKFDANGGKNAPEGIEGAPSSEISDTFPTATPTRKGYTFIGWNTAKDGKGTKITAYPEKFDSEHGTIYYYAQWKESYPDIPDPADGDPDPADPTTQAHIAFAANGGTGAPEGISGDTGSKIETAFPTEIPVAPGYKFVGWFTERTGGTEVSGYPANFADDPSTTIYYAHWELIPQDQPGHDPDKTEPTPNPADGDPDPVAKEGQSYVRFSANGGYFNKNIMTQAVEDEVITKKWSTDGLEGAPKTEIKQEQKDTFPSKDYDPKPVYRPGYEFLGWFTERVGGDEVTAYEDYLPGIDAKTDYYYAHWKKDPNYQPPDDNQSPKPGDPVNPNDEGKYPWEEPGTPEIDTPEPADVGKVMPADPDYKDLRITLSAKNETRTDGYTYVGDEVTYTILIENLSSPEKSWLDVIARADIPEGLKFIPGSIYLTTPQGEVIHVDDNVYNDVTRILALNAGDLAGGQTVKVVFKAEVTIDAINKDIGMTAKGYGTLPSEFDVEDESYVKPEIGSAFVPEGGWVLYDEAHMSVSNVEKVYPSEYVTAQEHVKGTPEEQEQAAKLAKTGDTTALVALGVGALAVAAGAALVLARRRMKKS